MKQRTSTRQVKLSKAFRVVDEDTRRSAREQRLLALEADNYNESELTGDREDDAFDSDDSAAPKKKKAKSTKNADIRSKWTSRPVKQLDRLLLDNGISNDADAANYYSIAAKPSKLPTKRPFCSVCGYIGDYTCVRCGSRYCSIRCNETHSETRCLKFSM